MATRTNPDEKISDMELATDDKVQAAQPEEAVSGGEPRSPVSSINVNVDGQRSTTSAHSGRSRNINLTSRDQWRCAFKLQTYGILYLVSLFQMISRLYLSHPTMQGGSGEAATTHAAGARIYPR